MESSFSPAVPVRLLLGWVVFDWPVKSFFVWLVVLVVFRSTCHLADSSIHCLLLLLALCVFTITWMLLMTARISLMSVTSSPINCSRCSVLLYSLQSPALDDEEDDEASLALFSKKRHQYWRVIAVISSCSKTPKVMLFLIRWMMNRNSETRWWSITMSWTRPNTRPQPTAMEIEFNFTCSRQVQVYEAELIFLWDRLQKFVVRDHPLCKRPIYIDAIIDKNMLVREQHWKGG